MLLELTDVYLFFSDFMVLDKVTLRVPDGSSVAILGPQGSGKSSLLKVAAGITPPDEGEIRILGQNPANLPDSELLSLRSRMGFVFQDAALWQTETLERNLQLPLLVHQPDTPVGRMRNAYLPLLRRFNMADDLHLRPAQLSAGEQKVVSLLRSLVTWPEILFLDEPTSSLGSGTRRTVLGLLKEVRDRGCSLVFSTNDAKLASLLANWVVVLDDGRVLASGPVAEVSRDTRPAVQAILTDVLSETASWAGDILDLMGSDS